jgi:hypothetical protein
MCGGTANAAAGRQMKGQTDRWTDIQTDRVVLVHSRVADVERACVELSVWSNGVAAFGIIPTHICRGVYGGVYNKKHNET